MSDTVVFRGISFRRYPDSPHLAQRNYYTPGIADRKRGVQHLHIEIWKEHHGCAVPPGCEIHHVDLNPLNNDLANLACLTVAEHKEVHREQGRVRGRTPEFRAHLDRIRPLTVDWHQSADGREWHKQHAAEQGLGRGEQRSSVCDHCGGGYETAVVHRLDRFCSNKCKSAARRESGVDNEQRSCARCGTEFTVNRYAKKECCGRVCAQRLRADRARAGVQPDGH